MKLSPFFKYYGSKNKLAHFYPEPAFEDLDECFAGGAGYACNHPERKVTLIDVEPAVIAIWSYLIKVKSSEIMALPLLEPGQSIDTLHVCAEARLFLSCCVNTSPFRKSLTSWKNGQNTGLWGPAWREKVARQVEFIRHWKVRCASYEDMDNRRCTRFVDPPYYGMEQHYRSKNKPIDYAHLAYWCRSRNGQTIVCERVTATWLPFEPLGASAVQGGLLEQRGKTCTEGVWIGKREEAAEPPPRKTQLNLFGSAATTAE